MNEPDSEARPPQYEPLEATPASPYRDGHRFESPQLHQVVRAN
jgi:hypothetical protein